MVTSQQKTNKFEPQNFCGVLPWFLINHPPKKVDLLQLCDNGDNNCAPKSFTGLLHWCPSLFLQTQGTAPIPKKIALAEHRAGTVMHNLFFSVILTIQNCTFVHEHSTNLVKPLVTQCLPQNSKKINWQIESAIAPQGKFEMIL